jgi:hypothetical protein
MPITGWRKLRAKFAHPTPQNRSVVTYPKCMGTYRGFQRKEPVLDHLIQAAMDAVDGEHDQDTGRYGTLHYTGCESRERATEIKQALFRAARHLGVSLHADIQRDGAGYRVEFTPVNKAHARAYVVAKYGNDRSKWPYSPYRGDPNSRVEV